MYMKKLYQKIYELEMKQKEQVSLDAYDEAYETLKILNKLKCRANLIQKLSIYTCFFVLTVVIMLVVAPIIANNFITSSDQDPLFLVTFVQYYKENYSEVFRALTANCIEITFFLLFAFTIYQIALSVNVNKISGYVRFFILTLISVSLLLMYTTIEIVYINYQLQKLHTIILNKSDSAYTDYSNCDYINQISCDGTKETICKITADNHHFINYNGLTYNFIINTNYSHCEIRTLQVNVENETAYWQQMPDLSEMFGIKK